MDVLFHVRKGNENLVIARLTASASGNCGEDRFLTSCINYFRKPYKYSKRSEHQKSRRFALASICLRVRATRHAPALSSRLIGGRPGRYGDPGISQFYESPEDNLIRLFKPAHCTHYG